ncbi:MAG: Hsp70 family protein [Pirellulaceae bacterium]
MGHDRRYKLRSKEFTAHELSSLVLRSLKDDASAALGFEVTEAVITVPALFHRSRATGNAGRWRMRTEGTADDQ